MQAFHVKADKTAIFSALFNPPFWQIVLYFFIFSMPTASCLPAILTAFGRRTFLPHCRV